MTFRQEVLCRQRWVLMIMMMIGIDFDDDKCYVHVNLNIHIFLYTCITNRGEMYVFFFVLKFKY